MPAQKKDCQNLGHGAKDEQENKKEQTQNKCGDRDGSGLT